MSDVELFAIIAFMVVCLAIVVYISPPEDEEGKVDSGMKVIKKYGNMRR